ncbi:MAG TPA: hypothetical protein VHY59_13325 [Chthoniobacterales bacterium]|nr:hypothetical protein [Chthoniobacterales bacterium]
MNADLGNADGMENVIGDSYPAAARTRQHKAQAVDVQLPDYLESQPPW